MGSHQVGWNLFFVLVATKFKTHCAKEESWGFRTFVLLVVVSRYGSFSVFQVMTTLKPNQRPQHEACSKGGLWFWFFQVQCEHEYWIGKGMSFRMKSRVPDLTHTEPGFHKALLTMRAVAANNKCLPQCQQQRQKHIDEQQQVAALGQRGVPTRQGKERVKASW
jgi:hypothetical protein